MDLYYKEGLLNYYKQRSELQGEQHALVFHMTQRRSKRNIKRAVREICT